MGYQNSSYYFLIFIIISVSFLSAIPFIKKTFSKTSDSYIVSEMNRVQSNMYFYKKENNNYKYACIHSDVSMLITKVLYELGSGLSCTTSDNENNIALYATLHSGDIYCVDSSGLRLYTNKTQKILGHCSN
jgi:hypothetical protein